MLTYTLCYTNCWNGMHIFTDFWNTRCTNCPEALDKLNNLAADERYKNVKFASICCGTGSSSDDARNIVEKEDSPRWDKISHFFMDLDSKEEAKKILGFKQGTCIMCGICILFCMPFCPLTILN